MLVCLGATAAKAIFGPSFRITKMRGQRLDCPDDEAIDMAARPAVVVTVHPSAVLRAPDRQTMYDGLVADLRIVSDALG